jgi:dynactin-6
MESIFLKIEIIICVIINSHNRICILIFIDSEALKIGDNNLFEAKGLILFFKATQIIFIKLINLKFSLAKIGRGVTISNGCIIGAKCELNTIEVLQDNTVIFGKNNQRRIANEKPQVHINNH